MCNMECSTAMLSQDTVFAVPIERSISRNLTPSFICGPTFCSGSARLRGVFKPFTLLGFWVGGNFRLLSANIPGWCRLGKIENTIARNNGSSGSDVLTLAICSSLEMSENHNGKNKARESFSRLGSCPMSRLMIPFRTGSLKPGMIL